MGMIQEFKEFAMKGNVFDLAVGVIIGGAFAPVVGSVVSDIMMPPIGWLVSGINFSDLSLKIPTTKDPVQIMYGKFLQAMVAFTITAFAVFLLVKLRNKLMPKKADAPAPPTKTEELLAGILATLKEQKRA